MTSPHYWAASPPTALAHSECDEDKGQNSHFGQTDVIQVSLEEEVAGPACGCCLRSLGTEGGVKLWRLLTRPSVLDLEGELRRPQLEPVNSRPGANGRAKAHGLPRDPVGVTAKRAGTKELGALVQAFQDFLQGWH